MAEKKAHIYTAVHRVSYSITQKLWHLSGLPPISLPNTTLVPKKSACFLQHTGCDIDNTSISSSIPRKLSRGGRWCFCLANNNLVVNLHTGLFAHACQSNKPDVLKLVCSTFCPTIHRQSLFMVTQLIHTLEVFFPSQMILRVTRNLQKNMNLISTYGVIFMQ